MLNQTNLKNIEKLSRSNKTKGIGKVKQKTPQELNFHQEHTDEYILYTEKGGGGGCGHAD